MDDDGCSLWTNSDDDREEEDEADEEMEAILYSQVHFECADAGGLASDHSADRTTSVQTSQQFLDSQCTFSVSVTPLRVSDASVQEKLHGLTDVSGSEEEKAETYNSKVLQPTISTAVTNSRIHRDQDLPDASNSSKLEVETESCKSEKKAKPKSSLVKVFAESSDLNISKSKDTCSNIVDTAETKREKTNMSSKRKFDMELELGMKKPKIIEKWSAPLNMDTLSKTAQTPVALLKPADNVEEFIWLGSTESDQAENRQAENFSKRVKLPFSIRQLVSSNSKKRGKEVVVIDSDDSSTNSSSSSDSDTDSTTTSDSESDSEVKTSTLDLNWNVGSADHGKIHTLDKKKLEGDSNWMINDQDMFQGQYAPVGTRYYTKLDVRCNNCNQRGHLSKVCPQPRKQRTCGLCGKDGHSPQRCPDRLCYNCNQPGHNGMDCPFPRRSPNTRCHRCLMMGHMSYECPDIWRQYHLTVQPASSEASGAGHLVMREEQKNRRVFCCNCARKGHFAFECTRQRMDKHSQPSYPFIASYDKRPGRHSRRDAGESVHQRCHSADTRSLVDRSERWRSTSVEKSKLLAVRSSGKSDSLESRTKDSPDKPQSKSTNRSLADQRNYSFPTLDRIDQSGSGVSQCVPGFIREDLSSKQQGNSGNFQDGDGDNTDFKTPAVPGKKRKQRSKVKPGKRNLDVAADTLHPEKKKKKKEKKQRSSMQDVNVTTNKKSKKHQEKKKTATPSFSGTYWSHGQSSQREMRTVKSVKGFKTNVYNLVISRKFNQPNPD